MFAVSVGDFVIDCLYDGLPHLLDVYVRQAVFVDQIDLITAHADSKFCCVMIRRSEAERPLLVVAQRYSPSSGVFFPGVVLVPETNRLFVGAGTRLLCYDLSNPGRVWEYATDVAFWSWRHDGDEVFTSAELEFAAFDISGTKLWTRFVEPPWDFKLESDRIMLDVMGTITHLDRRSGAPI